MAVNLNGPMARPGPSFHPTVTNRKEEWEDWSDDEPFTPIQEEDGELTPLTPTFSSPYSANNNYTTKPSTQRTSFSTARHSMQRIRRVKSRQRQKAQNAKAGIKLITDMTKLRQQQLQQLANQDTPNKGKDLNDKGKFADAAALNALEGMASDESIGTFAWLRKKRNSPASATPIERRMDRLAVDTPTSAELSPSVGGIMIGFAMPSYSNVVISPQTAVVDTPVDFDKYFSPPPTGKQPVSVWSPDTPDSQFTISSYRTAGPSAGTVPAVPAVPKEYRDTRATEFYLSDGGDDLLTPVGYGKPRPPRVTTTAYFSDEDDDMATPVTLFEEDGSPVAMRQRSTIKAKSPVSATLTARSQQGWWDQITSPFTQSPVMSRTPVTSIQEEDDKEEWWKTGNNNGSLVPNDNALGQGLSGSAVKANRPPMIVIEDVSQVEASSSSSYNPFANSSTAVASSSSAAAMSEITTAPMVSRPQSHAEKARILIEENESTPELPPPYSPPKKNQNVQNVQNIENVRYRAVFPPSHPLNSMYPPSPGPVSPGLAQTMTSQGAINLPYVPARPPPARPAFHHGDFPNRSINASVPATQRLKAEEKRRRNEKKDAMARKIGGLWRGRGCIPANGCFGRTGREGRKRRRWCLALFIVTLGLIGLAVALGVVLSRPKTGKPAPYSPWLNLTDFPPIPTGISTVIGTDSVTDASCAQDPRFWSCALPKDQTEQAEPFAADQPSFIIQIQYDNSTQQAWNVTGQAIPTPTPTKDAEASALPSQTGSNKSSVTNGTEANQTRAQRPQSGGQPMGFISVVKRLLGRQIQQAPSLGFIPRPSPPEFQDMYFLGKTTDGIVSDDKAGEPTPFYISILRTLDDSVGPNMLAHRDAEVESASNLLQERQSKGGVDLAFIPPVLNPDGTGAPAVLMPFPTQQPLRLFDRGLPTEHFGFYSYYNKTVYLTGDASSDRAGGSTALDSKFVITWLSARYKVEIWTRQVNSTRLLGSQSNGGAANNNSTRPGSFSYPVTVTLDTHGGIPGRKFAFSRGVAAGGKINLNDTKFILNNMNQTGDWVNPSAQFNPSFGGIDGGTGGCQCRYTNWVQLNAGNQA